MTDHPWRDEENLRRGYVEQGKSSVELSREWGCDKKTVLTWLDKHGIDTRPENKEKPVPLVTTGQGYERWQNHHDGDMYSIYVHQLLAICEYGFDEAAGSVVHHENEVKWDNRPENIQIFDSQAEHSKHHVDKMEFDSEPWHDEDLLRELYVDEGMSSIDIANELDCAKHTVLKWLHRSGVDVEGPSGENA